MIDILRKEDCVGCNACVQRCPERCIEMVEDGQGFVYPRADADKCIGCGLCERVCPVLNRNEPAKPKAVYAAKNADDKIRMTSSSGGVFHALARSVIEDGGVVFGAKFNERWEVVHDYAETLEEVRAFQGSKYVQSAIGDAFRRAEDFLKHGRRVMFTGTPCQLAGLQSFLGKDWGDKLLKVDVVCHGVPSPLVWREYLKYITASGDGRIEITGVSFRDKRSGWEKFGLAVRAAEAESDPTSDSPRDEFELLFEPLTENRYMRGFLKDLYLRPSCYSCPAKRGRSRSDITLADFCGIRYRVPRFYDPSGVSLLLINSDRGERVFSSLRLESERVSYDAALSSNRAIERSVKRPKQAGDFWRGFEAEGFPIVDRLCDEIRPSRRELWAATVRRGLSKVKRTAVGMFHFGKQNR